MSLIPARHPGEPVIHITGKFQKLALNIQMKSRIPLLVLVCVALCSRSLAGEKALHVEAYWPPKDRTKWCKALTAIAQDIEERRGNGTLPLHSTEKHREATLAIFAENGFKGPSGTIIFLNPEIGCFVVRSDKVFHRKLARSLGLLKKPE